MNKKFVLPISLMLLVGLAVFVIAQTEDEEYSSENMKLIGSHTEANTGYIGTSYLNYQINVNVKKGWNLLPGIVIFDINSDSDIKKDEIYNFIYNKRDNKYIQLEDQESFRNYRQF
jgi:hypothetical protein